jgi:hypothetical protein
MAKTGIKDENEDGIPYPNVKFDRSTVQTILKGGEF